MSSAFSQLSKLTAVSFKNLAANSSLTKDDITCFLVYRAVEVVAPKKATKLWCKKGVFFHMEVFFTLQYKRNMKQFF